MLLFVRLLVVGLFACFSGEYYKQEGSPSQALDRMITLQVRSCDGLHYARAFCRYINYAWHCNDM